MGNAQTRLEPDLDYSGKGMKVPSLIHGGSLVDLRHFELMRCVGKGAFGKVSAATFTHPLFGIGPNSHKKRYEETNGPKVYQ